MTGCACSATSQLSCRADGALGAQVPTLEAEGLSTKLCTSSILALLRLSRPHSHTHTKTARAGDCLSRNQPSHLPWAGCNTRSRRSHPRRVAPSAQTCTPAAPTPRPWFRPWLRVLSRPRIQKAVRPAAIGDQWGPACSAGVSHCLSGGRATCGPGYSVRSDLVGRRLLIIGF